LALLLECTQERTHELTRHLQVGIDEKDDEKRQRVLADWRSWLLQRC
jgi:hypothetical protein